MTAPTLQLVGFDRVHVKAKSSSVVTIVIAAEHLAVLNSTGAFVPAPAAPPTTHIHPCSGNTSNGCGTLIAADFFQNGCHDCKQKCVQGVKAIEDCCAECVKTHGALSVFSSHPLSFLYGKH